MPRLRRSHTFSGRPSDNTEPLQRERAWREYQSIVAYLARTEGPKRPQWTAPAFLDDPSITQVPSYEIALLQAKPVFATVFLQPVPVLLAQLDQHMRQCADRKPILEICHSFFSVDTLLRLKRSLKNFYHEPSWLSRCADLFSRPMVGDAGADLTMNDLLRFYALGELGMEVYLQRPLNQARIDKWFNVSINNCGLHQLFATGQDLIPPKVLENIAVIDECLGFGALLFLPREWWKLLARIEPQHMYRAVRLLQPSVWRGLGEAVIRLVQTGESLPVRTFQTVNETAMKGRDLKALLSVSTTFDQMDLDITML